jgi:hypothetical protein
LERRAVAAVHKATALLPGVTQYKKANVRVVAVDDALAIRAWSLAFIQTQTKQEYE